MIDYFQATVLGLVQGLTEFLPVSSSAHLILVPKLTHWSDQGIAFDVAVHFGTLFAVITYFRQDIKSITTEMMESVKSPTLSIFQTFGWKLGLATAPALIAGFLFHDYISSEFRSIHIVAATTLCYGLLLGLAEYMNRAKYFSVHVNLKQAILIGCAQALALIPGTSRSGVTLTAGLFLGLSKEAAARFSFLLAIPTILIACSYEFLQLLKESIPYTWDVLLFGCTISAISAYFCIHYFLKWISKMSLLPFAVYRVVLACFLIVLIWI